MTDNEREIALSKLKEKKAHNLMVKQLLMDKRDEYEEIKRKIAELKKDKKVQEFIELELSLKTFKESDSYYVYNEGIYRKRLLELENDAHLISLMFHDEFKDDSFEECIHPIWVYTGSFVNNFSPTNYYVDEADDENSFNFNYNIYQCIECAKKIKKSSKWGEWKRFEKKHIVIKNYPPYKFDELREEYFRLLLDNSPSKAEHILLRKYYYED